MVTGWRAGVLDVDLEVVLQVRAHPGQVDNASMPERRSTSAGPMPDSCSSCGELIAPPHRIDLAGADPARSARCAGSARRWPGCREDARRSTSARVLHRQVGPGHHRPQVGPRRRQPPAVVDVAVERRETLLAEAVHVVGQRVAGLDGRLEERPEQRVAGRAALQHQRAGMARGAGRPARRPGSSPSAGSRAGSAPSPSPPCRGRRPSAGSPAGCRAGRSSR